MFSSLKRKEIVVSKPFELVAYHFIYKKGLCIFEVNQQWRIISWWNESETTNDIPSSNFIAQYHDLPFCGGWVGWIQYNGTPFFWKTDGAIVYHIPTQKYTVVGSSSFLAEALYGINHHHTAIPKRQPAIVPTVTKEDQLWFCSQITKLREAIHQGMVYQANLSRRSKAFTITSPLSHYLHIQKNNPARFGAYLQFDNIQVISNSPELFVHSTKCNPVIAHSQPIKGTAKEKNREQLWSDTKERAELTMIADLVRNDLGKIAQNGTVFTKARALRHCGDLLHAEQSIYAHLQSQITVKKLLQAMFPAGSITGAPKKSAMEYIALLERHERKLYTGAIGWISSIKHCHFTVAIRTLYIENQRTHLHVGCGIVYDSEPQKEWDESIAKGNAISKLLFT
ncbi:MAG: hypothetical protein CL916_02290 [Deltaproteobacteria bacterium]|nr:hypothetical protein [Deltaproteobacteria bacterium]